MLFTFLALCCSGSKIIIMGWDDKLLHYIMLLDVNLVSEWWKTKVILLLSFFGLLPWKINKYLIPVAVYARVFIFFLSGGMGQLTFYSTMYYFLYKKLLSNIHFALSPPSHIIPPFLALNYYCHMYGVSLLGLILK